MPRANLRNQTPVPSPVRDAAAPVLGYRVAADATTFGAYVTTAERPALRLYRPDGSVAATYPMRPVAAEPAGFFEAHVAGAGDGTLYKLVLDDGRELPDPFARYLPQGVYGPAMVVESRYTWRYPAPVRAIDEYVIYELHVGTFSESGTYRGAIEHIDALRSLGVTAVELMPVAAFAGTRGWGYDGVAWFAPFAPYGSPDELRELVDALHGAGLSVLLDVVYNHFGPAGAHLRELCPDYFTSRHKNAWGDSLNYQHPVLRRVIGDNARYWLEELRFDGLRLDAIHAIEDRSPEHTVDRSPEHIVAELSRQAHELDPPRVLVAEDERNDPASITKWGCDAVWADDFHHAVRVTLTAEREGYFAAYRPGAATVAETIENGWLYRGQISPWSGEPRGAPANAIEPPCFVYCIQNHDQIGNRAFGDRLSTVITPDQYRAASTLLLFLPMTPLLFMGQEWGARTPFLYFTDHDPDLGRLIVKGRREEFRHFPAFADPVAREQIPDPQALATFARSHLRWAERDDPESARTLDLYRALIALRTSDPVLRQNVRQGLSAGAVGDLLIVRRTNEHGARVLAVNLGPRPACLEGATPPPSRRNVILSSGVVATDGDQLPPWTAVIFAVNA